MSDTLPREPGIAPGTDPGAGSAGRLRRWALASAGVLCVALGAVGVFVPGLPTTIFLILASFLFTRSCPWLEERLLRRPLFAPYLKYVDGRVPLPAGVARHALLWMWGSIGASLLLLSLKGALSASLAAAILAAGAAGTWFLLWRAESLFRSRAARERSE